jgi:hypothetical protein
MHHLSCLGKHNHYLGVLTCNFVALHMWMRWMTHIKNRLALWWRSFCENGICPPFLIDLPKPDTIRLVANIQTSSVIHADSQMKYIFSKSYSDTNHMILNSCKCGSCCAWSIGDCLIATATMPWQWLLNQCYHATKLCLCEPQRHPCTHAPWKRVPHHIIPDPTCWLLMIPNISALVISCDHLDAYKPSLYNLHAFCAYGKPTILLRCNVTHVVSCVLGNRTTSQTPFRYPHSDPALIGYTCLIKLIRHLQLDITVTASLLSSSSSSSSS